MRRLNRLRDAEVAAAERKRLEEEARHRLARESLKAELALKRNSLSSRLINKNGDRVTESSEPEYPPSGYGEASPAQIRAGEMCMFCESFSAGGAMRTFAKCHGYVDTHKRTYWARMDHICDLFEKE